MAVAGERANFEHLLAPSPRCRTPQFSAMLQVITACLLAGFGNVGAGIILNYVQEWPVFTSVDELFILVPALLGLKGNLEMTMASRLSTQANLGNMNNLRQLFIMTKGNLALVQCQATVVSFAVAIFASLMKWQDDKEFNWDNALVLSASSLLTANIACFVLGTLMVGVIVLSYRFKIDPDNVAAPVAASLGDMTTAGLLAVLAHSIYFHTVEVKQMPYLPFVIIFIFLGMLPIWIAVASTNPYTSQVVTRGWFPIVLAVVISAFGGLILSNGKSRFQRLAVFQPVINGVGGNLVAVQASRLSTAFHKTCKLGEMPPNINLLTSPYETFFTTWKQQADSNTKTARLLLLVAFPAHLLYLQVISLIEGYNPADTTWLFLSLYMSFAMFQIVLLLYMAKNLVNILWKRKIDPDNYAIPILTASGDLLGCAFLYMIFLLAYQFNDPFAIATDTTTKMM